MTTHKEALTRITRDDTEHGKEYYLASDVDALLAQPEHEPVALYKNIPTFYVRDVNGVYVEDNPLNYYTTPPQRKLTDEPTKEMIDAAERIDWSDSDVRGNIVNMWQAMCAAHPKEPEQEPVATLDALEQEIYENTRQFVSRDVMEWMLKRYYTTPPQRKPLTDEQKKDLFKKWADARGVWPRLTHEEIFYAGIEAAHGIKGEA